MIWVIGFCFILLTEFFLLKKIYEILFLCVINDGMIFNIIVKKNLYCFVNSLILTFHLF
jgi:hypothetical protein